jgi:galactokinase
MLGRRQVRSIVHGSTHGLPDAEAFLRRLGRDAGVEAPLLPPGRDVVVARAPARLSLFGGLGDAVGGRSLHWPLAGGVLVAVQRHAERHLRMAELDASAGALRASLELPLHFLERRREPIEPAVARAYFQRYDDRRWAARLAGAVLLLLTERRLGLRDGLRVVIQVTCPADEGVGASVALDAALLRVLTAVANVGVDATGMVRLVRRLEEEIAAAPFAVPDVLPALLADAGRLFVSTGSAADPGEHVAWPDDLAIAALSLPAPLVRDTRRRAIVRQAGQLAYRIAADLAQLPVQATGPGRVAVDDPRWQGRLSALTVEEFDRDLRPHLPETMTGGVFLDRYGGTIDPAIPPAPATSYPVAAAAAHIVAEHDRARQVEFLLGARPATDRDVHIGRLLDASRASHRACGLVDQETDEALTTARTDFLARGGVGLCVAAGGQGHTIVAIARAPAAAAFERLARDLERAFAGPVGVDAGTSPGALRFGVIRLRGR